MVLPRSVHGIRDGALPRLGVSIPAPVDETVGPGPAKSRYSKIPLSVTPGNVAKKESVPYFKDLWTFVQIIGLVPGMGFTAVIAFPPVMVMRCFLSSWCANFNYTARYMQETSSCVVFCDAPEEGKTLQPPIHVYAHAHAQTHTQTHTHTHTHTHTICTQRQRTDNKNDKCDKGLSDVLLGETPLCSCWTCSHTA